MRVTKPLRASLVHRVFDHQKRHLMVVTVGYCVSFDRPKAPVTETEMWKMAGTDIGRFGVLDHWMWKPQAEVLVTGACYPGEQPKSSDFVRLLVGPEGRRLVDKKLYVFGERRWTLLGPTEPETFTRMPIDYAHAFGGESFPQNPVGKGHAALLDLETDTETHVLPNVEDPRHLLVTKGDKAPAASLAPWDPLWPHHFEKKMGTYDKDWVQKNGFSLADDIDLSLFNVAAPDQRVKGFFEGTEEIRVEHMHPEKRVLETTLPGFRARSLVRFHASYDPTQRLVDVRLSLDTIHVFPHRERVIVFFRGIVEIQTSDASDVDVLMAGFEDSSEERRPIDDYARVLALRTDKQRGALHALRDRDLMPASAEISGIAGLSVGDPIEEVMATEHRLRKNMHRRAEREYLDARERLIRAGVEPELVPPPPAPFAAPDAQDPIDLAEMAETLEAERDQALEQSQSKSRAMQSDLAAFCKEHGIDLSAMQSKARRDNTGPPKFSADEEIEKLRDALELADNAGMPIPAIRERLEDPNLRTSLLEIQQKLAFAYRLSAHYQDAAEPMSEEDSARARAALNAFILGGARDRRDFTGAQLAGLDLSGIDLEGVFLESANLAGANLSGATLKDAVLSRANLEGANLEGANLVRANLGRARLSGARLSKCDLENAILYEADLSNASLRGARLSKANTLDLRCDGADFTGIEAEQLLLFRAKLKGAAFRGARLFRCVFMECEASDIDCTSSDFSKSVFLMSNADRADFSEATIDNFRIVMSSFERASFKNARMPGSNLREAKLFGASFAGANLRRSILSGADMRDIDASRALFIECLMIDTNLDGAKLVGANMMLAIMHRATLRGADASKANLFCADLTGAVGDDKTSFAGSNVKRALVAGVAHG